MKFCEFCGRELAESASCTCTEAIKKAAKRKKAITMGVIVGVLAFITLVVAIVIVSFSKIDPSAFLSEPQFSGYNTVGTATVEFDKKGLIESVIGEEPSKNSLTAYSEWEAEYRKYANCIKCEYPTQGLSNGDTFIVSITVTGIAAEKIKSVELKFTVSGLLVLGKDMEDESTEDPVPDWSDWLGEESQTPEESKTPEESHVSGTESRIVDIFQYIVLKPEGLSGDAKASLAMNCETTGDEIIDSLLASCKFSVEPKYGLSNGDTVCVTLSNIEALQSAFFDKYDLIPYELSKEYVVSGLSAYATIDDLPMDIIMNIAEQFALDEAPSPVEGLLEYSDVKVYGSYFLTPRDGAVFASDNELQIIICYDKFVRGEYTDTIYIPLIFKNIIANANSNVEIKYEDGRGSGKFYTNIEKYMSELEADYEIIRLDE